MVSTLRCGRSNLGSNPSHGSTWSTRRSSLFYFGFQPAPAAPLTWGTERAPCFPLATPRHHVFTRREGKERKTRHSTNLATFSVPLDSDLKSNQLKDSSPAPLQNGTVLDALYLSSKEPHMVGSSCCQTASLWPSKSKGPERPHKTFHHLGDTSSIDLFVGLNLGPCESISASADFFHSWLSMILLNRPHGELPRYLRCARKAFKCLRAAAFHAKGYSSGYHLELWSCHIFVKSGGVPLFIMLPCCWE